MNLRKPKKITASQRQRISMKLVIGAGISVVLVTLLLVIYFQFSQNEVTKAKNVNSLTGEQLPVDLVIEDQITVNPDTLMRNGLRYKVAKPLK